MASHGEATTDRQRDLFHHHPEMLAFRSGPISRFSGPSPASSGFNFRMARRTEVAHLGVIGERELNTAFKNRPDARRTLPVCNAIRLNFN